MVSDGLICLLMSIGLLAPPNDSLSEVGVMRFSLAAVDGLMLFVSRREGIRMGASPDREEGSSAISSESSSRSSTTGRRCSSVSWSFSSMPTPSRDSIPIGVTRLIEGWLRMCGGAVFSTGCAGASTGDLTSSNVGNGAEGEMGEAGRGI